MLCHVSFKYPAFDTAFANNNTLVHMLIFVLHRVCYHALQEISTYKNHSQHSTYFQVCGTKIILNFKVTLNVQFLISFENIPDSCVSDIKQNAQKTSS